MSCFLWGSTLRSFVDYLKVPHRSKNQHVGSTPLDKGYEAMDLNVS